MKKYLILLAGGLLCAATAVAASPSPQHDDRGQQDDQGWHDNHGDRHDDKDKHNHGDNGHDRDWHDRGEGDHDRDRQVRYERSDDRDRGYYVRHDRGRHEGWYQRGEYIPVEYRDRRYVVDDWQTYHLRQPPRGYRYVRSDNGDFLLVAITTGIIASTLANH